MTPIIGKLYRLMHADYNGELVGGFIWGTFLREIDDELVFENTSGGKFFFPKEQFQQRYVSGEIYRDRQKDATS